MKLILPKRMVKLVPEQWPIFFLAGPIKGGRSWQKNAAELLERLVGECFVASPLIFDGADLPIGIPNFDRQLDWERHYLELGSERGCIVFWLPCEDRENPCPKDHPYARDTRGELGEWRGRLMNNDKLK